MNKKEILAGYMSVLDDITRATNEAIETLRINAETSSMIIQELIYEEEESSYDTGLYQSDYINEDADSLSEKIIEKINSKKEQDEQGIHFIDIAFDMTKVNPNELMELIKKKMANPSIKKENPTDDIDFENPFE